MCQVVILTKTKNLTSKHVQVIANNLLATQRDGFGYAIQGQRGVFGERTTLPRFKSRLRVNESLKVEGALINPTHESFGIVSKPWGAGIFHGRTSTNDHTLINTHPLQKNNWTLIHNGVVNNKGPGYEMQTTNDTEHILHWLSTEGISAVEKYISGYYAIGAIDPEGSLHIARDNMATLFVAKNASLDCHIFATTSLLLQNVAKQCNWKIGPIEQVKENSYFIFNVSGALKLNQSIKPLGYGHDEARFASKSLGFKVYETKTEEHYLSSAGYEFYDWNNRRMSYEEFMCLDEVTKLDCTIIKPDGTILDYEDLPESRYA